MNVLCDFHHTDLFRSFRLLFEKRLGFRVFRPLGLDWWEKGYFFHPEPAYGKGCLTKASFHRGHLRDYDLDGPSHYPHGRDWREWSWITLDEASRKIDLVVSSYPSNEEAFARFVREARPQAKIVRYIGNEEEYPSEITKNALISNWKTFRAAKRRVHSAFFHPEIDPVYGWADPPKGRAVVRSFLNYLYHDTAHSDLSLFRKHAELLKGKADFYMHGLGTPPTGVEIRIGLPLWSQLHERFGEGYRMPDLIASDGEPESHEEIASLMKASNLAWHVKRADGFGYALHQLYASGRPVICERKNYEGKTGGLLLQDKKTCVMLDGDPAADAKKIERFLDPGENLKLCRRALDRYRRVVDHEREAKDIRKFLARLR